MKVLGLIKLRKGNALIQERDNIWFSSAAAQLTLDCDKDSQNEFEKTM